MEQPIPSAPALSSGSGHLIKRIIEWGIFILFVLFSIAAIVQYNSRASVQKALSEAQAAFDRNDLVSAVTYADQVLARNQGNVTALILKASALAQQGSLQFKEKEYGTQAIAVAQQALAVDPDNVDAWRIIGYSHEIMQRYVDAHAAYAKALEIDPQNAAIISQNAHAYDLEGDAAHALMEYYRALQIDPTLTQAQMGYARSLLRDGRTEDAKVIFQKVADTAQNARHRAEGAYSAGVLYAAKSDHAKAQELMIRATQLDPLFALAWVGLGAELFSQSIDTSRELSVQERQELGNHSFAALQKAIEINPAQTLARLQVGVQLAALGKKDDALKELELAKKLAQTDITLGTLEKAAMIQRIDGAVGLLHYK